MNPSPAEVTKVPVVKEKRKKTDQASSVVSLEYPPCKVCSGKGSGKHYGVYTCQSCKTFYRRYLKRDKPYTCAKNGNCKIVSSGRGNCSACRIKKCEQVGMSVDGVKIGRCTLEERNKTIIAVNEFESRSRSLGQLKTEITKRFQKFYEESPKHMIDPCTKPDIQTVDLTSCNHEIGTEDDYCPPSIPDDLITHIVREYIAATKNSASVQIGENGTCPQSGENTTCSHSHESGTGLGSGENGAGGKSGRNGILCDGGSCLQCGSSGISPHGNKSGACSQDGLGGSLSQSGTNGACLSADQELSNLSPCPNTGTISPQELEHQPLIVTSNNMTNHDSDDLQTNILKDIMEESQNLQDSPSEHLEDLYPLSPGTLEDCFKELMEWTDQEGLYNGKSTDIAYNRERTDIAYNGESTDVVYNGESTDVELGESRVKELVDTFREISIHPNLTDEEIKGKLKKEHQRLQAITQVFGQMTPMSHAEYAVFFSETGLDIDGRMEFHNFMSSKLSKSIQRIVHFAHKIPGFKTLSAEDQANLIRASKVELRILVANRAVDPELEVCMMPNGEVIPVTKMWHLTPEARGLMLDICRTIQNLHLTEEETALCMGITLTFTDRCHLQQKRVVERINTMLMNSLQESLQKRLHTEVSVLFCKVMDLFMKLRTLTNERDSFHKSMLNNEYVRKYVSHLKCLQIHPND